MHQSEAVSTITSWLKSREFDGEWVSLGSMHYYGFDPQGNRVESWISDTGYVNIYIVSEIEIHIEWPVDDVEADELSDLLDKFLVAQQTALPHGSRWERPLAIKIGRCTRNGDTWCVSHGAPWPTRSGMCDTANDLWDVAEEAVREDRRHR